MPQHLTGRKNDLPFPVQWQPSPAGLTLQVSWECWSRKKHTWLGQRSPILHLVGWAENLPWASVEHGWVRGTPHQFGDCQWVGKSFWWFRQWGRQGKFSQLLPGHRTVDGGWSEQAHGKRSPKLEGGILVWKRLQLIMLLSYKAVCISANRSWTLSPSQLMEAQESATTFISHQTLSHSDLMVCQTR